MKHFQSLSESAKHWLSVAERLLTMCLPSLLAYWVLGLLTALAVLLAVIIMASYFWTRLPRRFDANGWIPLHEAYRYLVYDTQWADNQLAGFCRGAFDNLVSAEMHERLARSEILSRGKFGGSQDSLLRATEPIASSFWVNAFSQPYFEIVLADDHQSIAATKGGGQLYRAILLKESDVRRAWPQRRKIAAKPTKISSVVNALRLTIAAETLAMKAL